MADPQNTTPDTKTSGADATPHNPGLTPKPGDPAGAGSDQAGAGAGEAGKSGGLPSDVEPDPSQQPG